MITSATQLKDYVKNLAKAQNIDPQILLRMYMMERFLERMSVSRYRNNIIMKGGTLVASLVGANLRATMDLDVTVMGVTLKESEVLRFINDICQIEFQDNTVFSIKSISPIMDEADYAGLRVSMLAVMDKMRIPLKIDISTGDAITPKAIEYQYKLLLEDRQIELLSYNIETVLAEKFDTIIERDISNTRMRDFYDIYILEKLYREKINISIFREAVMSTARKRRSLLHYENADEILKAIQDDKNMRGLWSRYSKIYVYAKDIKWDDVMRTTIMLRDWLKK